jgi:hypothetical protein
MKRIIRGILCILSFVVVGWAYVTAMMTSSWHPPSNTAQTAGPVTAEPEKKRVATAEPEKKREDSTNILENKKFLASNPKYVPAIKELIKVAGYSCPALSFLWYKGESPYGLQLEALCGPNDNSGRSYPKLHYAVYPEKFKVHLCGEFGTFSQVFGGECS